MFSLDLDCVFVEGYTTRNKVDDLVECEEIPRSYWNFLWFVDNQLVRRVKHLMRVFHWWYCIIEYIISTLSWNLAMLLTQNCNYVSCIFACESFYNNWYNHLSWVIKTGTWLGCWGKTKGLLGWLIIVTACKEEIMRLS